MKRIIRNIVFLFSVTALLTGYISVSAQEFSNEKILLFISQNTCVSGDTIWIKTNLLTPEYNNYSKIIHIQLDNPENKHITKSIIKTESKKGNGYLVIPDSLSTGTYFLRAFTNIQKEKPHSEIAEQNLIVFNRFEEKIQTIKIPEEKKSETRETEIFGIKIEQKAFNPREKVKVNYNMPENISDVIINVSLTNFTTNKPISGYSIAESKNQLQNSKNICENNGIVVSGKVINAETKMPESGITVFLCIADSIPYLDYYFSENDGSFYFYLKETYGLADLVLRTVPVTGKKFLINLEQNFIEVENRINLVEYSINNNQKNYIDDLLKTSRFKRLFYPLALAESSEFIKPQRFKHPFYGKPTSTVFTRDYIDLPNFNEISKELLIGSKWRERKDTVFLKILNFTDNDFFTTEPFKLLDGIPIFDLRKFADKSSETIDRIDIVANERMFGDMVFKGVLAVYSKKIDLNWLSTAPDIFRFNFQTIQIPLTGKHHFQIKQGNRNTPDFRSVLFWERIEKTDNKNEFEFITSDLKGDYSITISGIKNNGDVVIDSINFEVK